jgi:hypothetical protein
VPAPNHKGRSAEEILGEHIHFDSAGYFFRAVSWVDYNQRNQSFAALIYACTDARLGLEYLMFEDLIVSTGANLSEEQYQRCTKERNKFTKLIKQLSPDYEKLKDFTRAVIALDPQAPTLIYWNHSELLKSWGKLSNYLHWFGAITRTTDNLSWVQRATDDIAGIIHLIWQKMTAGRMGLLHTSSMEPRTQEVWIDFKNGKIDFEGLKTRLKIIYQEP